MHAENAFRGRSATYNLMPLRSMRSRSIAIIVSDIRCVGIIRAREEAPAGRPPIPAAGAAAHPRRGRHRRHIHRCSPPRRENRATALGQALSTPARLADAIEHGVEKAGASFSDAAAFLHGSTIAINTMLERSGAKTALLTTEGFRDIYEIGRINRPDAYNLYFRKHVPLVERALRFEVRERITAEGEIHVALDEASVHAACDRLDAAGVTAVAIMLLHSYVNPRTRCA